MRPGDIADATGIDKKELDKVIKMLKDQELIYSPKRCFYQPNKQGDGCWVWILVFV